MKKFLLLLAVVAFTVSAALGQSVTKNYKLNNITGIDASSVYKIKITKGNSDKIEVICPDYLSNYIKIYSLNGIAYFKTETPRNFRYPRNTNMEITVNMQMSTIKYIDLSGASSLYATGEFTTNNLTYDLSGASHAELNISGKYVQLSCNGASMLSQRGNFDNMKVDCSGASKMIINGNINDILCDISGATNFTYNGNSNNIELELSGASKASLTGRTNNIKATNSGASFLNAKGMISTDVSVEATGASKANVYCTNILKANASSSSIINYYGNPKQMFSKPSNIRKAD
ncbi:MAG: DUF2807 domain-containing protein [Bacteroidales bacterium]